MIERTHRQAKKKPTSIPCGWEIVLWMCCSSEKILIKFLFVKIKQNCKKSL